jgi:DNA polymerase alpha subunit B
MFSVGMVICDGEGHLNEKSILLQGSVEHSRGQHVRLDLKDVDRFSLFPGQVSVFCSYLIFIINYIKLIPS